MNHKNFSWNSEPPKGKDVKETRHLEPGSGKEFGQSGTNDLKRHTTKGASKRIGALGAKGFGDGE